MFRGGDFVLSVFRLHIIPFPRTRTTFSLLTTLWTASFATAPVVHVIQTLVVFVKEHTEDEGRGGHDKLPLSAPSPGRDGLRPSDNRRQVAVGSGRQPTGETLQAIGPRRRRRGRRVVAAAHSVAGRLRVAAAVVASGTVAAVVAF